MEMVTSMYVHVCMCVSFCAGVPCMCVPCMYVHVCMYMYVCTCMYVCVYHSVQVFHDVAYKARNKADLLAGIDEFLDKVTVLPPGEWDPQIRLEPPPRVASQVRRYSHHTHSQEAESYSLWLTIIGLCSPGPA